MDQHDNQEEVFAALVLHGKRFDAHSVPLEVLKELENYQRLVVEVAKALFRARHDQRKRVPKGFEARLNLSLRTVEEGSAMPVLLRTPASKLGQANLLPSGPDEFEVARDEITAAVQAIADNKPIPASFPKAVLGRFNTFGRGLRSDESIELRRRPREPGPRYDMKVRKTLVLLAEKSYSNAIDLVGRICEADVDNALFQVLTDDRKIPGAFTPEHEGVILLALKEHDHTRVRLLGTGRFDASDKLERIEELDEVMLIAEGELTAEDLNARIQQLTALEEGWLEGHAAPDPKLLKKVADILAALHRDEDLPVPHLYPTPLGGLQAEWTIGSWELSATIDLGSGAAELDAVDGETGADKEAQANLYTASGQSELVDFVASFTGKDRST